MQRVIGPYYLTITLKSHDLQELVYETSSTSAQLGVFSEVYYPKGWNAYIDGEPVKHIRANYALRALPIPAGEHTIAFKFEPRVIQTGSTISLVSALLLLLLILGGAFFSFRNSQKTTS